MTATDSLGANLAYSTVAAVTVAASPTVTIATVGTLTLDAGQSKTFTDSASGGSGSLSYQWYLDGAAVGSNSASYSYTAAAGSHSVTCKVTDSASTTVTSPISNAVSVTVNSAPTVTISPGSAALDVGQSQLFTATHRGGTGSYTGYQWYVKGLLRVV